MRCWTCHWVRQKLWEMVVRKFGYRESTEEYLVNPER